MKKKRWIVLLVVLLLLFGIGFSVAWVWNQHKAKLILKTLQTIAPEQVQQVYSILPSADTLEQMFSLPEHSTLVSENQTIVIPESVQAVIDAAKTGDTPTETERKKQKFKKQINEWVELFSYLLPENVKAEDIAEEDVEAVVSVVRSKMTTGEAMKLATMAEGGLSDEEKQEIFKILSQKFTEDELTMLVQIYRKYTE